MRHFLGFAVLQSVLVAGLIAAWSAGLLSFVWTMDQTRLSVVIVGIGVVGLGAVALGRWETARFLIIRLLQLGLIGTLIGLMMAVGVLVPERVSDTTQGVAMMAAALSGLGTALMTTLVASVASLWLSTNIFLLKK